jgi:hypothetical protein
MLDVVFCSLSDNLCLYIYIFLSFRVPTNAVMTCRDLELCENCSVEETTAPPQGTRQVFIVYDFSVLVHDLTSERSS